MEPLQEGAKRKGPREGLKGSSYVVKGEKKKKGELWPPCMQKWGFSSEVSRSLASFKDKARGLDFVLRVPERWRADCFEKRPQFNLSFVLRRQICRVPGSLQLREAPDKPGWI